MVAESVAVELLAAFDAGDLKRMRGLMAEDCVSWVTTAEGTAVKVEGRDAYLVRVGALDLPSARYSVTLTQPPVVVDGRLVLLMVEIRAERATRSLHNFASHLLRIEDGAFREWWMTDAKPAESERFWA